MVTTLEKPLAYECEAPPRAPFEHYWEHQLTDLLGKPTGPLHVKKAGSWTANFAAQMRTRLSNTDTPAVQISGGGATMTNGITTTKFLSLQIVALPDGAGTANRGTQPGSGATPPAPDTLDFVAFGAIGNGAGGGALLFQDDVMHDLVTITNGFRIFHERLFLNVTSAAITITNVALYGNSNVTPSSQTFCHTRDNITIVVPLAAGVIIKYRQDWTV